MRDRLNLSLPAELIGRINEIADRKRVTRSAVVEAAVESFLSPDHADMQEAALTRRLDRLSRQIARLERDQRITTETLALFVRFWLRTRCLINRLHTHGKFLTQTGNSIYLMHTPST